MGAVEPGSERAGWGARSRLFFSTFCMALISPSRKHAHAAGDAGAQQGARGHEAPALRSPPRAAERAPPPPR
eukprot:CAMPEP_0176314824 /NCGR_PEP_ID=MMETSP0121_2-20121125/67882_1 /TAXON_ID=160619 /ORGANISM="Kryptoperidinium foliaceum, Strain CCMP 1326" /LENGTH=71 /DNA_ID=CAMNT_0017656947 /DNA_START=125 /DNA_END=337 /DNA_ORIENTATION=-